MSEHKRDSRVHANLPDVAETYANPATTGDETSSLITSTRRGSRDDSPPRVVLTRRGRQQDSRPRAMRRYSEPRTSNHVFIKRLRALNRGPASRTPGTTRFVHFACGVAFGVILIVFLDSLAARVFNKTVQHFQAEPSDDGQTPQPIALACPNCTRCAVCVTTPDLNNTECMSRYGLVAKCPELPTAPICKPPPLTLLSPYRMDALVTAADGCDNATDVLRGFPFAISASGRVSNSRLVATVGPPLSDTAAYGAMAVSLEHRRVFQAVGSRLRIVSLDTWDVVGEWTEFWNPNITSRTISQVAVMSSFIVVGFNIKGDGWTSSALLLAYTPSTDRLTRHMWLDPGIYTTTAMVSSVAHRLVAIGSLDEMGNAALHVYVFPRIGPVIMIGHRVSTCEGIVDDLHYDVASDVLYVAQRQCGLAAFRVDITYNRLRPLGTFVDAVTAADPTDPLSRPISTVVQLPATMIDSGDGAMVMVGDSHPPCSGSRLRLLQFRTINTTGCADCAVRELPIQPPTTLPIDASLHLTRPLFPANTALVAQAQGRGGCRLFEFNDNHSVTTLLQWRVRRGTAGYYDGVSNCIFWQIELLGSKWLLVASDKRLGLHVLEFRMS